VAIKSVHSNQTMAVAPGGNRHGRLLVAAIAGTLALSVLFVLAPSLDIGVSSLFYRAGAGFPAIADRALKLLRSAGLLSINAAIAIVVVLTILRCLIPARWLRGWFDRLRPSALLFLAASLAIGPGLIANVILKDHWGRARPIETSLFGGDHAFTLPWVVSNACVKNCSFVSGEASAAFWFVALAFVVPEARRRLVAAAALIWATTLSLNRIAFGGHFLSDVLIGWGLTLIVMLVLGDLLLVRRGATIDAAIDRWTGRR